MRNCQKVIFWHNIFLTRIKKNIFGKKSPKICQNHLIHVSRECFLTFLINFFFLKMLAFLAPPPKMKFWPKSDFYGFFGSNFTYRLITAYFLLRVNLDKIMHSHWDFDASSARTRRVSALDKHQNWSASALLSKFSSTK